jgi:hypothetical protein
MDERVRFVARLLEEENIATTTRLVNGIREMDSCLILWLWSESFGILHTSHANDGWANIGVSDSVGRGSVRKSRCINQPLHLIFVA